MQFVFTHKYRLASENFDPSTWVMWITIAIVAFGVLFIIFLRIFVSVVLKKESDGMRVSKLCENFNFGMNCPFKVINILWFIRSLKGVVQSSIL